MEKQVFEYGLMSVSANPNSGTVGPSPLEKYRVSETRLRLKVLSAHECMNWINYDTNDLSNTVGFSYRTTHS